MPVHSDVPGLSPARALAIARVARSACARGDACAHVRIVAGNAPPKVEGSGPHYRTKGGTRIVHPSAYSKAGWSNMTYVGSTREIVVGARWKRGTLPVPSHADIWKAVVGEALVRRGTTVAAPSVFARRLVQVARVADAPTAAALHRGCANVLDRLEDAVDLVKFDLSGIGAAAWRVELAAIVEASRVARLVLERRCAEVELLGGVIADRLLSMPDAAGELQLVELMRHVVTVEAPPDAPAQGPAIRLPLPLSVRVRVDLARLGL